ncbi:MAG: TlyA family RNA methyltransferase [Peptococcaceae bacterium]|nr:MAG: TlyA family RNA methyltransferase [Peptococcaceae bacterium]
MACKQRLDTLLLARGFFPSRERAQAAVLAGLVFINNERADKPGIMVSSHVSLEVRGDPIPYASRGGLKLERAIKSFNIELKGRVVLDVGASTGGFTDCVLKYGARLVYAVDVGYGQLAWRLRNDPRVVVLDRTNIRFLSPGALAEIPDFAAVDVSFISLSKVLARVGELTAPHAFGVALIKPQFEAGREKVGKKGVVRDPAVHVEVIKKVAEVIDDFGWVVKGIDYSPLKGPQGNIEYLICFAKEQSAVSTYCIPALVEKAHKELRV